MGRVERAPAADRGELRQERPARDDELAYGVGQADAARGEAPTEIVDELGRGRLAACPAPGIGRIGVEVREQRCDQAAAVLAVRLAVIGGPSPMADGLACAS